MYRSGYWKENSAKNIEKVVENKRIQLPEMNVNLFVSNALPIDFVMNPEVMMNPGMYDPLIAGWETYFRLTTNIQVLQSFVWLAVLKGLIGVCFIFGTIWFWDNKLEIID